MSERSCLQVQHTGPTNHKVVITSGETQDFLCGPSFRVEGISENKTDTMMGLTPATSIVC